MHRDAALGAVDPGDQHDQSQDAHHHQNGHPPCHGAGAQRGGHIAHHAGHAGQDACEQDNGDTVADTELGDLLTHPHDEGGAGDKGDDDDQSGPDAGVGQDTVVLHQGVVAPALQDGDGHRCVTGNGLDLLLALLAAVACHALQRRDGDGQQLDDDGAVDIGLHTQREDCGFCKGAAGHDIVQAQNGGAQLVQVLAQQIRVHIGNGDGIADTEDQQDQGGEHQLLAELGDRPRLFDRLDHVRSPLPFHRLLRSLP